LQDPPSSQVPLSVSLHQSFIQLNQAAGWFFFDKMNITFRAKELALRSLKNHQLLIFNEPQIAP